MNEHEQEVADLHEANKHVRDHAFLQGQLIQQLECKLVAAEAVAAELRTQLKGCVADLNSTIEERCRLSSELETWKARAFDAERKQDAVTHDLFAMRARYDAATRESEKARAELDRAHAAMAEHATAHTKDIGELRARLLKAETNLDKERDAMRAKYDATARERDELLARLELPARPDRVVYVTQAGARAFTEAFGGSPAPSTPEVTLHDMTIHAGAKFSCGDFKFVLQNDVRLRQGVNVDDLILDPVEVQS